MELWYAPLTLKEVYPSDTEKPENLVQNGNENGVKIAFRQYKKSHDELSDEYKSLIIAFYF